MNVVIKFLNCWGVLRVVLVIFINSECVYNFKFGIYVTLKLGIFVKSVWDYLRMSWHAYRFFFETQVSCYIHLMSMEFSFADNQQPVIMGSIMVVSQTA